jgi:hypothetical protein
MAAAWKGRVTRNDVISFAEAAGTDVGAGAVGRRGGGRGRRAQPEGQAGMRIQTTRLG